MNLKILSAIVTAGTILIPAAYAQNLLLNGSFENPSVGASVYFGAPTDWTALRYNYVIGNGFSSDYLPATDGTQIDDPGNPIEQNVSLVANQQYLLTFDLSTEQSPGNSESFYVGFSSSNNENQFAAPIFTVAADTTSWVHESYTFTPTETSSYTMLIENYSGDGAVDNMVLEPEPVPEPSSFAFLGLGALFPFIRRNGKNTLTALVVSVWQK